MEHVNTTDHAALNKLKEIDAIIYLEELLVHMMGFEYGVMKDGVQELRNLEYAVAQVGPQLWAMHLVMVP